MEGATGHEALAPIGKVCGESCRPVSFDVFDRAEGVVASAINSTGEVGALVQIVGDADGFRVRENAATIARIVTAMESDARKRGEPGLIALPLQRWVLRALVRELAPAARSARCVLR